MILSLIRSAYYQCQRVGGSFRGRYRGKLRATMESNLKTSATAVSCHRTLLHSVKIPVYIITSCVHITAKSWVYQKRHGIIVSLPTWHWCSHSRSTSHFRRCLLSTSGLAPSLTMTMVLKRSFVKSVCSHCMFSPLGRLICS